MHLKIIPIIIDRTSIITIVEVVDSVVGEIVVVVGMYELSPVIVVVVRATPLMCVLQHLALGGKRPTNSLVTYKTPKASNNKS